MRLSLLFLAILCTAACSGQPEGTKSQISREELEKLRKAERERMLNDNFIMGDTSGRQAVSHDEPEKAEEVPRMEAIEEEQGDEPEAQYNSDAKESQPNELSDANNQKDQGTEAAAIPPEVSQQKGSGSEQADEPPRKGAGGDAAQGKMQAYAAIARELGGKYGNLFMINAKHYGAIAWQLAQQYGRAGWSSSKHYGKIAGKGLRVYGAKGLETAKRFAKYGYRKGINGKDYLAERYREYRSRKTNN